MLLDGTLLLQMIHFGIAYAILTHIFLKPALARILHEEGIEQQVRESLVIKQEMIRRTSIENKNVRQEGQKELQDLIPSVDHVQMYATPLDEEVTAVTVEQQEKLIAELTHVVVEGVLHD